MSPLYKPRRIRAAWTRITILDTSCGVGLGIVRSIRGVVLGITDGAWFDGGGWYCGCGAGVEGACRTPPLLDR